MTTSPALAYFFGDDGYGLDRAADAVFDRLSAEAPGLDRWQVSGDATTAGRIAERVATGSLFGGGTLVVLTDPGPLVRSKEDRDALIGLLVGVIPVALGLAWLPLDAGAAASEFSIRSNGVTLRATVVPTPFYDPDGTRMRS